MDSFDAQALVDSAGAARTTATFRRSETIFAQGEPGDSVVCIQKGGVKLSVASPAGREVIIAMLGPGEFCGQGGLSGQAVRTATATALTPTRALVIARDEMIRVLRADHALSGRFIACMLERNTRIEEDLIDQLFDSSEKRLARALLLLAGYGANDKAHHGLPRISQASLADSAGMTRSSVRSHLKKFARLGFIARRASRITVDRSLLSVVLAD